MAHLKRHGCLQSGEFGFPVRHYETPDSIESVKEGALEQLQKKKAYLERLLHSVEGNIEQIKTACPHILKSILGSEEKTAQRRDETQDILAWYDKFIETCARKIDEMLM